MDCKTARECMDMYVDNVLRDAEKERFLLHVKTCKQCQKELDDLMRIKHALAGLDEREAPRGLAAAAIKKAKKRRVSVFAYASVAAAAVAAMVFIIAASLAPGLSGPRAEAPMAYSAPAVDAESMMAAEAPEEAADEMAAEEAAPQNEAAGVEQGVEQSEAPASEAEPAEEAPAEGASDICRITVPEDLAEHFHEALNAFIAKCGLKDGYAERNGDDVVTFMLTEECFDGFVSLLEEEGIPYRDALYPGCTVEIVF